MIIKKIIAVLFIANIGLVKAQYTAIPDAIFEYFLIDSGIDSLGVLDGQVLTTDIENITELIILPIGNILDLTGIQGFTSLEILDCADNNLTELDISQNLQLRNLRCSSNQLISIDISNNVLLERLVCPLNQINTFISGNNILLEHFEISNNNLTSLNVSNFPNLIFFGCGLNNISSLDLTQNPNLEQLGLGLNDSLEYLDLRNGNNELITFFYVTEVPNLTCIFVDDANYSTINWLDVDPNSTFVETEAACQALATNDFTLNHIKVYPNPVTDFLVIENNSTLLINTIKIYDFTGKEIGNFKNNTKIDFTNYAKGLYNVVITTQNGIITKKIVKK